MQTPDVKIDELVDITPKEKMGSPKKISLNVEPLPLKEETLPEKQEAEKVEVLEEPTLQALDVSI